MKTLVESLDFKAGTFLKYFLVASTRPICKQIQIMKELLSLLTHRSKISPQTPQILSLIFAFQNSPAKKSTKNF